IHLRCAPLGRRIAAALTDFLIVGLATALFGLIFWKMTGVHPPFIKIVAVSAAVFAMLWATFQYLLLVYAANTPGLRLAGLELLRFDGVPAHRKLRRWRVLTSFLSAASLGMGYAWVFLDEDALCWHDRITHTHLALKRSPSTTAGA